MRRHGLAETNRDAYRLPFAHNWQYGKPSKLLHLTENNTHEETSVLTRELRLLQWGNVKSPSHEKDRDKCTAICK